MIKLNRKAMDNISNSSPTRSSKTLKSKIINNPETQVTTYEPPYFKDDPLRAEMEKRARVQQMKLEGLMSKPKIDHLMKAGKIVEELLKKHEENKEKLAKMKEEAEGKFKKQYPFTPDKKKIQKYVVPGDIIKRNQAWMLERQKKVFERKEEKVVEDMSQCTFQPVLMARRQSEIYLKNRSFSNITFMKKKNSEEQSKAILTPHRHRRDVSRIVFETEKKRITDRILGLPRS